MHSTAANLRLDDDLTRRRHAEGLSRVVRGEVRFDQHNRMLYATDASIYQVEPIGVVIPADLDDAAAEMAKLIENLNAPEGTAPHEKLSDRELQTLVLIASGRRLSDIATELTLSPKTVSVYRARVLEKLGLTNNSEMTVYAIRNGLV
jgi:DNA-binding NarL/FixJ family response regulator